MNENKEKYIYLDSNILINYYLDKDYLTLLKDLKSKYNISYIVSHFVIYEVFLTLFKNRIAEYLIKERNSPITEIIHKWKYTHTFYKKVEEDIAIKIDKNC